MKNYTIEDRIKMTLGNMEFQGGYAMWDDIEKLEHILTLLLQGKNIKEDFEFVDNHFSVIKNHIKELEK